MDFVLLLIIYELLLYCIIYVCLFVPTRIFFKSFFLSCICKVNILLITILKAGISFYNKYVFYGFSRVRRRCQTAVGAQTLEKTARLAGRTVLLVGCRRVAALAPVLPQVPVVDVHQRIFQDADLRGQFEYLLLELLVLRLQVVGLLAHFVHLVRHQALGLPLVVPVVALAVQHPHDFRAEHQGYGYRRAQLSADERQCVLEIGADVGEQEKTSRGTRAQKSEKKSRLH